MPPTAEVGYLLHHVPGVLFRQSDQVLLERLGIGFSQFKILILLQWQSEVTQRELAERLGQTEASISRQIKLLQGKALLTSHVDPGERRRRLAVPTAKGLKLTIAARDVLADFHAPLLARLSDRQRQQLQEILTTLHEHICAPGQPLACDRTTDIETIYAAARPAK